MKNILLKLAKKALTEVLETAYARKKITKEVYNDIVVILAEKGINVDLKQ